MPDLYQLPPVREWIDVRTGKPTRIFVEWMQRLWDRAGGTSSFTNTDLTVLSAAAEGTQQLRREVEDLEKRVGILTALLQAQKSLSESDVLAIAQLTRARLPEKDEDEKSETLTASATINTTYKHHFLDGSSAAVTATLPDPTTRLDEEHILTSVNTDNATKVTGHIQGAASTTETIYLYESFSFKSDGTTWRIHG